MSQPSISPGFFIENPSYLNQLLIALTVPSITVNVLVLLAFAYTAWHPHSRRCLDRVSFRLLVYALIANLLFGAVLLSDWSPELLPATEAGCTCVAFLNNIALLFSAAMFFSMALNLQLVLVHGINGQKMEKYYLIGAAALTAMCSIATLATGHFGYFAQENGCWFTAKTPDEQLGWVIGAQAFWVLAMAVGEVLTFLILVGFMWRHQRSSVYIFSNASHMTAPIVQYRPMILRIGLYPLLSCALNFSATILDLYLAKHKEDTSLVKRLDVMDVYVYALRPFFYACLAATDPSFIRGLQALRKGCTESTTAPTSMASTIGTGTGTTTRPRRSTGSSTQNSRRKHFSFGTQAMVRIDFERIVEGEVGVAVPPDADVERVSDETGRSEMVEVRPEESQTRQAVDAEEGVAEPENTTTTTVLNHSRGKSQMDEIEQQI